MKKRFILSISGASGTIYGLSLLTELSKHPFDLYLIISKSAESIILHENKIEVSTENIEKLIKDKHKDFNLHICESDDFYNPPASGSFRHDGMIVAPCSMKTLAEIANGLAQNLISRSADVTLKERKPLILLTRETPLNLVHIKNMEKAHLAGATIMPPVPSFYNNPKTIDDIVKHTTGRVFDQLEIEHCLFDEWGIS
ncbi:MAG: UbiX family flavin prenyltransferase [Desulfobacterales bacterium]|nr:UbiX family flavin prenyltransferase [Desulfobacterales bacterium]